MPPEIVAQLWAALAPELTTYFRLHLPNPEDAEDATSECFTRLVAQGGVELPVNLLRKIARNYMIDVHKRDAFREPDFEERRWQGVSDRTEFLRGELDPDYEPEVHSTVSVEDWLFSIKHDEVIRDLEADMRDAYILGELRGLNVREAAPLLGVGKSTAASRRELATTVIREEISA